MLLLTEGLGLGIAFDSDSFAALPHGWWTPLLHLAGAAMPAAAALLAAAVLLVWARGTPRTRAPEITVVDSPRRYVPCFLLHVASFGALVAVSRVLFGGSPVAMSHPGAMVATWLGAVALTVGSWLMALVPPSVIARQVGARAGLIAGAAALGLVAFLIGRLAQGLWMPLRQATFASASFVLALLSPTAVADPATLELGAQKFVVEIAPQCSGYEGVGLTWAFVLAALWLFRARLRFPAALLLLVPATLLPFIANIGRLVCLVLLGAYVSPELAEGGFHSYAGSILFCAVALGIVAFGLRMHFFARDREAARAADGSTSDSDGDVSDGTVAAYLVPFLVMTGAGLISRAFSGGDSEPLFALRPAAGLVALVLLNRRYRALVRDWTASPVAWLGGVGVAAIWLAFERWWPASTAAAGLASAPPMPVAIARATSAIVLVPIVEELAFRGFLARRICAAAFDRVDAATLPWRGLVISSVAFGLLHHRPVAGIVAGLAYGVIYRRRGVLGDAVVAHAVTNVALVLVACVTGRWDLWT